MNSRLLRVLSIRPFLYLFSAEVFSQIAMNMGNFVLIVVAFKLAASNTAVAGIVLSFTVPAILFGMIAGVYVDRWEKKRVLLWTNLIRAFFLFLLALFHENLVVVYVLSFATASVTQFFIPAETPVIPILVKKEYLLSANALFGMGIYGSLLLAYALSSPTLLWFGQRSSFVVIALLFLIAAFFVWLMKVPRDIGESAQAPSRLDSIRKEVAYALSVIVKTKEISQSLLLLALSQLLILILAVVGPAYASRILGITVDAFPLFFITPAAVGMVVGAIMLGNFFHTQSKQKSTTIGVILAGISLLALPYGSKVASRTFVHTLNLYLPSFLDINILHIMVFLAFVLGFANALVFVPSSTILQEVTSDAFRGRVYGALNALVGVLSLLPIILVGELADLFGVGRVITGVGIFILCIGVARILLKKK